MSWFGWQKFNGLSKSFPVSTRWSTTWFHPTIIPFINQPRKAGIGNSSILNTVSFKNLRINSPFRKYYNFILQKRRKNCVQFRPFCVVTQLLVNIEGCGFYDTWKSKMSRTKVIVPFGCHENFEEKIKFSRFKKVDI